MTRKNAFAKLIAMALVCAFTLAGFTACADQNIDLVVDYNTMNIEYNGKIIENDILSVDLSAGEVVLTVSLEDGSDITDKVAFESNNTAVATVSGTKISLVSAGRAVITATSSEDENASSHIILEVIKEGESSDGDLSDNGLPTITVGGCSADYRSAVAGTLVTLTPIVPEGQEFLSWVSKPSDLVITDNTFVMPDTSVSVGAAYGYIPNEGLTMKANSGGPYTVKTIEEGKSFSVSYENVDASKYSALGVELSGAPAGAKSYAITFKNTGTEAIDIRMDMKTSTGGLLNGLLSHGAPDGDFFTIAAGQTVTVINGLRTSNPDNPSELYTEATSLIIFIDSCRWEWSDSYLDAPVLKTNTIEISNLCFFD